MDYILASIFEYNQVFVLICLMLAVFRVYLEVVQFDFEKLPMTKLMVRTAHPHAARDFHRMGLYFSIGYILLFGPTFFLS